MWRTHPSVNQCQELNNLSDFLWNLAQEFLFLQNLSISSEFCEIRVTNSNNFLRA